MSDSMPVRHDITEDANYRLGAANARLLWIRTLVNKLLDNPSPDHDDPAAWAVHWDTITQVHALAEDA